MHGYTATHTQTHIAIFPLFLLSLLLHNLMRRCEYVVCIYTGLFVLAGEEFG